MPTIVDFSDLLKTESQATPLAEVLGQPPTVLLGVSQQAADSLKTLDILTVFDLAMSGIFNAAVQLDDAADNVGNAMNRFGRPVSDLVKPGLPGTTKVTDLRFEDVGILAGIDDAEALKTALGVVTVRDLAVFPPFHAAKAILDKVFFPEKLLGFDADSPADLIPKSGEFPTEKVQYSTLILDQILRPDGAPALIDLQSTEFKPIDISPVTDPNFGFQTLGLGALLTISQSWFMQGVTLGHLLHSMALAPGESTRIAVIDWSRKTSAGQTEQIGETEDLSQDTSRNRSISEVTEAVAREAQEGFSKTKSSSTTKQAGASAGISIGPFGGGASASISKTNTSGESYSTTSGSREVGASMLQQASDRTHQNAHSARTRRASVVREVSQTEHENVSTRVVANYNHMHALTVQYYEVLQVYRTETSLQGCERVVFVPFKLLDFSNEDLLQRFRGVLIDEALTLTVRDALINFDTLEFVPERRVPFRDLRGSIADSVLSTRILSRSVALRARRRDDVGEPGEVPERPERPEPPEPDPVRPEVADVVGILWDKEAIRLGSILGSTPFRRGSESLFVPADVRVFDAEAISPAGRAISVVFHRKDGTKVTQLQTSMALSEIDRISLNGSSPNANTEVTVSLALSRNGVVFPLELPTVTVAKGATETKLMGIRASSADVNLVQHLNDNKLHYSQAIFRNLDAAMIAGLLSPFSISINGKSVPLVQVAEPTPLRIVGNALAFKIATDPINDEEWRGFMAERGLTIGASKVDLIPLSSGGIFAEAVLGRFNCAEKIDLTRFWNWQDSPIPIQPTEIAAVQTGTRGSAEDVRPGQLGAPILNITPPAALPDPTGMAGILAAIQNGNMFRDMSGLAETIKLAAETAKLSAAGATAVGNQANEAMKTAVTADTERRKIAADVEKAKLEVEKAKVAKGKDLSEQTPTVQGGVINEEKKAKADAAKTAEAKAAGASKNGQGSGSPSSNGSAGGAVKPVTSGGTSVSGGGTSTLPGSSGIASLDRIIGNDASLRSFIGLDSDSPVPTPTVTREGVPLTTLDFVGNGYSLQVDRTGGTGDPDFPTADELKTMIGKKEWYPAAPDDFRPLLLGERVELVTSFSEILQSLALVPKESVKTLNIVAHAQQFGGLDFAQDLIFSTSSESTELGIREMPKKFINVELNDLMTLSASTGPVELLTSKVLVSDIRQAFPTDGEVRVFNLSNRLTTDFIQAMANLFQVRVTGFAGKPVRVRAEIISETGQPFDPFVLAKKIDVGFSRDPVQETVDFFENLLVKDRAVTGAFTAFPRR